VAESGNVDTDQLQVRLAGIEDLVEVIERLRRSFLEYDWNGIPPGSPFGYLVGM